MGNGNFFANVPKLVTCIKMSRDEKYLAAGCLDGFFLIYEVRHHNQNHEIFERFRPHTNKITDMVFISNQK